HCLQRECVPVRVPFDPESLAAELSRLLSVAREEVRALARTQAIELGAERLDAPVDIAKLVRDSLVIDPDALELGAQNGKRLASAFARESGGEIIVARDGLTLLGDVAQPADQGVKSKELLVERLEIDPGAFNGVERATDLEEGLDVRERQEPGEELGEVRGLRDELSVSLPRL